MDLSGIRISKIDLEDKLSNVLLRHTDYTKDQAIDMLRENNYNIKKILFNEYGISEKSSSTKNTSQQRFKYMRNILG